MQILDTICHVTKLTPDLGAEIKGCQIKEHFSMDFGKEIRSLLSDRGVLVFKDQNFTPDDQVSFVQMIGGPILEVGGRYELEGHPQISVLSNIEENGKAIGNKNAGQNWHTDSVFSDVPAGYTCLFAIEVPEVGGGTAFGSLRRAYNRLSDEEKDRLRPLRATYSYREIVARLNVALTPEQLNRYPDVSHPLMRIHPESGKECIFINDNDLVSIDGMTDGECRELVERVFAIATEEEAIYVHSWSVNDLVVWDNRIVLHRGMPYDMKNSRRLLHRCWTRSEMPLPSYAN